MYFKSVKDLSDDIEQWIPRIPREIECVVGIPRSGMLVANLLALKLNLPIADLDGLLAGRLMGSGRRLEVGRENDFLSVRRDVLVVDDSISSGKSMEEARAKIASANLPHRIRYGCVYGKSTPEVLTAVNLPKPRRFEWNILSTKEVRDYCFDMDGVLCCDPEKVDNDDGERYLKFIRSAVSLYVPKYPIGYIVTSRLERYRAETEEWLARHGISYGKLLMLDLASRAERVRLGAAIPFKAEAYRATGASLFVESDWRQAEKIAALSGGYVYSVDRRVMVAPGGMAGFARREGKAMEKMVRRKVRACARMLYWRRKAVEA